MSSSRNRRVYYLGMISTDAYARSIGEQVYSGAAARKMMLVARAMRSVGIRAILISLPFVGTTAQRAYYGPVLASDSGVPALFCGTFRSVVLRKLVGPFILAVFFLWKVRNDDTIIFYNYAIEYIPAILILSLRGSNLVLDIEDAPIGSEPGHRGFLNRILFPIFFRLTKPRKMVVAEHVARNLKLTDYVTIRGVASPDAEYSSWDTKKWVVLCGGGDLKLHIGGTLVEETGIDLFCEAVELFALKTEHFDRVVQFKVTGIGELDKVRRLQRRIQSSNAVEVELLPELSASNYLAMISSCHGSLSLRRPGSDVSNTTFPSKVIEITSSGMALVTTSVGDVPTLFKDSEAYFVQRYDAESLVDIFISMSANPKKVARVADAGRGACMRVFSLRSVGKEMGRLL